MDCRTCTKCGATWMGGKHFWKTGKPGNELDLAGLVCNNLKDEEDECINPARGQDGGQTWDKRLGFIEGALEEYKRQNEEGNNVN